MFNFDYHAPDYQLKINGKDITPLVDARLINLTITDNAGYQADTISLTLTDHDGKLELPPTGAEAHIFLGWKGQPLIDKGTYIIDEIEHSGAPDIITLSGKSADLGGSLGGQKSRSFRNITIGILVRRIAAEHKLKAVIDSNYDGMRLGHLDQTAESDLNMLNRLAAQHGALATVKSGILLFIAKGSSRTASGAAMPVIELNRADIAQHRYLLSLRDTYTGIKASYNERSGSRRKNILVGTEEKIKELRNTYASEQAARTAARAELERAKRGEATLSLTLAKANIELQPECELKIKGLKKDIDEQQWVTDTVTHALDGSGLSTQVEIKLKAN